MSPIAIVQLIRHAHADLRKSERKVADYVLAQPDDVIHMRIVDLAQEASVSEPTVVRFCRAIGYNSFQSFKVALAQYVAHHPRIGNPGPQAPRSDVTAVIDNTMEAVDRLRSQLDIRALEGVAALLTTARRVEIYGFGRSGLMAQDAQQRLLRVGITAIAGSDPLLQMTAALSLDHSDVLLAFSRHGHNCLLLETLARARTAGAPTVAVAPAGSPVLASCDIAIALGLSGETTASTHAAQQLVALDVLINAVARLQGNSVRPALPPEWDD